MKAKLSNSYIKSSTKSSHRKKSNPL